MVQPVFTRTIAREEPACRPPTCPRPGGPPRGATPRLVRAPSRADPQAAARIMYRTGYHGMSMQAVAERAGMSVGSSISTSAARRGRPRGRHRRFILEGFRARVPTAMDAAGADPEARLRAGSSRSARSSTPVARRPCLPTVRPDPLPRRPGDDHRHGGGDDRGPSRAAVRPGIRGRASSVGQPRTGRPQPQDGRARVGSSNTGTLRAISPWRTYIDAELDLVLTSIRV